MAAYTGTLLLVTHDRYLMQTLGCPILYLEDGKATFYPNFAALQNRDNGKTQEQQKAEDTVKKQAYGKEQRKRRAEVRARIKAVENQIEELGAHIVELENEINDPRSCATTCCCGISATNWTTPASTSRNYTTSGKSSPRSRKPSRPRTHNVRRAYSRSYTKT